MDLRGLGPYLLDPRYPLGQLLGLVEVLEALGTALQALLVPRLDVAAMKPHYRELRVGHGHHRWDAARTDLRLVNHHVCQVAFA